MPDADDFDVEYFRNLLKGNTPKEGREPLAETPLPGAKRGARLTSKAAAAKEKSKPAASRKRSRSRC